MGKNSPATPAILITGFPGGTSGKEATCQCWRQKTRGFDPWVRKTPQEKEMATHSSVLAWRIPWTEEPGRLWSIGSQSVRHDWSNLARTYIITYIYHYNIVQSIFTALKVLCVLPVYLLLLQPLSPPSPSYSLSLWICLFWGFPINWVKHVAFCIWLLSPRINNMYFFLSFLINKF